MVALINRWMEKVWLQATEILPSATAQQMLYILAVSKVLVLRSGPVMKRAHVSEMLVLKSSRQGECYHLRKALATTDIHVWTVAVSQACA